MGKISDPPVCIYEVMVIKYAGEFILQLLNFAKVRLRGFLVCVKT